jgi:tetratricopeptide (TPR) repeat protein
VVSGLEAWLEPGDLCLAERPIPGGERVSGLLVLPRDSRNPDRYDFVYWSRWYEGFRFVLVSETQVRQNLQRASRIAAHFYGRLANDARMVAEFGDPVSFRLFELPPGTTWREPLTREELAAVRPVPDLGSFLSQLGSLYAESGNRRTAAILFEAGARLDPDSDALANNLGSIYLLEREWEEAAAVFQKALDRRPDSPELLYNYARALFELNVYVRAEMLYRKAVSLRPDFADAHYELARCFLAQDKERLAGAALRRYLELAPDTPRRADVERVLATLAEEAGAAPGEPRSGSGVPRVGPGVE